MTRVEFERFFGIRGSKSLSGAKENRSMKGGHTITIEQEDLCLVRRKPRRPIDVSIEGVGIVLRKFHLRSTEAENKLTSNLSMNSLIPSLSPVKCLGGGAIIFLLSLFFTKQASRIKINDRDRRKLNSFLPSINFWFISVQRLLEL